MGSRVFLVKKCLGSVVGTMYPRKFRVSTIIILIINYCTSIYHLFTQWWTFTYVAQNAFRPSNPAHNCAIPITRITELYHLRLHLPPQPPAITVPPYPLYRLMHSLLHYQASELPHNHRPSSCGTVIPIPLFCYRFCAVSTHHHTIPTIVRCLVPRKYTFTLVNVRLGTEPWEKAVGTADIITATTQYALSSTQN